jgi:hypothetical protein
MRLTPKRARRAPLALVAIAPLLAGGAPAPATGPDYWVALGGAEQPLQPDAGGALVKRVVLVVGNSGSPGQYRQLAWIDVTTGGGAVCSRSATIDPPVPGHAVSPVLFELRYPPPLPPHEPMVDYRVTGHVAQPNNGQPYEDGNTTNNQLTVTLQAPSGARASCLSVLPGQVVTPKVLRPAGH